MVSPENLVTPLTPLRRMSEITGVDLWAKRDDLSPIPGGGSKYRKLASILAAHDGLFDTLVTTGGTQSNHARVTALVAAQLGLECELVLHGDPTELECPTGNLLLMSLSGAHIHVVPPEGISSKIAEVMEVSRRRGRRPLLVDGGGHSVHGAMGLVAAVHELAEQCRTIERWTPDYIVHASGTGGTQAGILAGLDQVGWQSHVIGVSVSRSRERGTLIVQELYDAVRETLGIGGHGRVVDFRDQWIEGGYAKSTPRVWESAQLLCRTEGIPVDPTYTAKAMLGLLELIEDGTIPKGSRVLFWHTGGLLNLMAAARDWRP